MGTGTVPEGFVEERRGRARLLLRSDVSPALLDAGIAAPEELVARVTPIRTYRGRGRPILVEIASRRLVLRRYRHGGFPGRLLGGLFLRGDRAREELAALEAARSAGVDAARPVAAVRHGGAGPFYRALLATEAVEDARDLVAWVEARARGEAVPDPRVVLQAVGAALRRLHDAGIAMADLHVKNVLVRSAEPEKPVLIDFDRSRVRPGPVPRARRLRDLFRFDRSLEKLVRSGSAVTAHERARLFRGYLGGDRMTSSERRSARRRYRLHMALHRLSWRLSGR
jgi:tRNA A-37 threonylcarbamoyl transferase component Bud32